MQPANPSSAPIGDSEGMNTHTPSTWSVQNTKETNLEIETYYTVPKLKKRIQGTEHVEQAVLVLVHVR